MMKIETDSEEKSAGAVLIFNQNAGMLELTPLTVTVSIVTFRLPNSAVDLAPFGRWTLRDKAAQRRSSLR